MKQKGLRLIQTLVFCLLLLAVLSHASGVLERKESRNKFGPFFEQKEDFDVLFLGNSHMVNGVLPLELYQDYGIVSYNMAGYGNSIPLSYWVMKNALDYTQPRVVVLEIHNTRKTYRLSGSSGDDHKALDVFPLSLNKARAIEDLMSDPEAFNDDGYAYPDLKWEFYFPLGKYHSRWNHLTRGDFIPSPSVEKGAETFAGVSIPEDYEIIDENAVLEEYGFGFEYLRRFIEDCQAMGVEVLLTHLPFPANEEEQMEGNAVWYIADEYGVDYLDFVNMDQVADYSTDLFDSSHLNASGAKKVSDFLGRYLVDHYGVEDRRGDARYAAWDEDLAAYHAHKITRIQRESSLESLLMLAHDRQLGVCIALAEGAEAYHSEKLITLMHNIAREHIFEEDMFAKWSNALFPLEKLDAACASGEKYVAVIAGGEICEWTGSEIAAQLDTPLGRLSLGDDASLQAVSIDQTDIPLFGPDAQLHSSDVQLVFFDLLTGKPVHCAQPSAH